MSELRRPHPLYRSAWTLTEVLIVIAVMGLGMALLVPAIQKSRESASRSACANNLRQMTIAVHACNDATGAMPPYSTGQPGTTIYGGWWVHLLPYVSESPIYDEIFSLSNKKGAPGGALSEMVVTQPRFREHQFALLRCASDPTRSFFGSGATNYLANWFVLGDGIQGCYSPAQDLKSIRKGISNAVLFAEGYSNCKGLLRESFIACGTHNFGITWHGKPSDDFTYLPANYLMYQVMPAVSGNLSCDNLRAQTAHTQMPVAFADGSVRFFEPNVPLSVWTPLMKPREPF